MMRYYKATRPDGTSFRGSVDYASALDTGTVLTHPAKMVRNNPATYFSVSVAAADCTGMCWPCRLFEVEPVGRIWRNDHLPNKRCCSKLRVVEELPAHFALGPNGEQVAALVERAGRLTPQEFGVLAAAWAAARDAAGDATWVPARAAARAAARVATRDAAGDAAGAAAWAAARALLVRDLISQEHFDVLYGPWARVVEEAKA